LRGGAQAKCHKQAAGKDQQTLFEPQEISFWMLQINPHQIRPRIARGASFNLSEVLVEKNSSSSNLKRFFARVKV
jgi:hypothetical protein